MAQDTAGPAQQLKAAVESLAESLGVLEGDPVALDGGITNRNFRVTLDGHAYVVRLHGAQTDVLGIDREAERIANALGAQLGIAPAVAASGTGFLVTDFVSCNALDAAGVGARAEDVAQALRRFHDADVTLPTDFDVRALLQEYAAAVERRGGTLPTSYADAQRTAAQIARAVEAAPARPCHNDLLAGNLIVADGGRLLIVDWEYAGMGHPYFDLGNVSVNNDFGAEEDARLLRAYLAHEPSDAERATLALMRVLSDAREAAWGVVQGLISELEFDFAGYANAHFERMRAATVASEFEEWLAAASA